MGGLLDGLRGLFRRGGGARTDALRGAAREVGGVVVPARGRRPESLRVDAGPWRVTVETEVVSDGTSATVLTRALAFFPGRRDLRLKVVPRRRWHRWVEAVRGRRPLPLSPAVRDRYTVSGEPTARIPSFFSPELIQALLRIPDASLEVGPAPRKVRRRRGDGVGMVRCRTKGVVTSEAVLVTMVAVVSESLDALHRIGEASRETRVDDPATDLAGGEPPGRARRRPPAPQRKPEEP